MKTSIDIAENLFKKAKRLSRARNISMRALVEEGLRLVLDRAESQEKVKPKLLTFGGDGFQEGFDQEKASSWEALRGEIYREYGA